MGAVPAPITPQRGWRFARVDEELGVKKNKFIRYTLGVQGAEPPARG
jgi:hypothetical protein